MKGFKNVKAYVDGKIRQVSVAFDGDTVKYVGEDSSVITEEIKINGLLCPGFIDEHIHGAGGCDMMDADEDSIRSFASALVCEGVTSFLPTTVTYDLLKTMDAIKVAREFALMQNKGARVIGVHLEGPFINVSKCGAQNPEYILTPQKADFDKLYEVGGDFIKLITVAPEIGGALEFIEYVKSKGVSVSAGHTSATFSELKKGVDAGINCVTHTFNAMSGFSHREAGVAGGSMLLDVYNEIIGDGIHVNFEAIKILSALKSDKLILITDSLACKGVEDKQFLLGGQPVSVVDNVAKLPSGTIAGSILKMNVGIKNLVQGAGLSIETAIKSATENPARNLNVFDKYGSIAVGKTADFAVLDENFNVTLTVIGGKIAYQAK